MIPPRLAQIEDKDVRFYVFTPASVRLALITEAHKRGSDLWTLCGSILSQWLDAGCPDSLTGTANPSSPAPSLSSSVAGHTEPAA
jgi:hypothetical protein